MNDGTINRRLADLINVVYLKKESASISGPIPWNGLWKYTMLFQGYAEFRVFLDASGYYCIEGSGIPTRLSRNYSNHVEPLFTYCQDRMNRLRIIREREDVEDVLSKMRQVAYVSSE